MLPLLSLLNNHPGLSKHHPFITVLIRHTGKKESGNDEKGNCNFGNPGSDTCTNQKTILIISPDSHKRLNRILKR